MHSKAKGNIGEAAVILALVSQGFCVFRELGDLSRIDLVAEKGGKILRIQVKAATPKHGAVTLNLKKTGPNYHYHYQKGDVDYFALVDLTTKQVAFVPETVLDTNRSSFALRLEPSKTGQVLGTRRFDEFLTIRESTEWTAQYSNKEKETRPKPPRISDIDQQWRCKPKPSIRKAVRPPIDQLKQDIEQLGYCGAGRKYGVTDNAIRKWLKFEEKHKALLLGEVSGSNPDEERSNRSGFALTDDEICPLVSSMTADVA